MLQANEDKAVEFYKVAVENGSIDALNRLAWKYFNGLGVAADPKEAYRLWEIGAEQQDSYSLYQLGVMCEHGSEEGGIERDEAKASEFYRRASEAGDVDALLNLAMLYTSVGEQEREGRPEGSAVVTKDEQEANKLFRMAADRGSDEAMIHL